MTWLLKNYKWAYAALAAAGLVPTLLSLWSSEAFAVYYALVLVCLVGGGRWLSRLTGRGTVELYRDCDPEPMLANCDRLLAGAGEACGGYLTTLRLNRAGALLALGRREEAGAELVRLAAALPEGRASAAAVTLGWYRAELALEEERLGGLEGELDALAAMAQKLRVPSLFAGLSFPEQVGWQVERGRCMLLLRTAGPVLPLLPRLRALVDSAPCALYQTQAAMELAEYHLARGEQGLALPHLRRVALAAPHMAIGVRARDKLAHLDLPLTLQ